MAQGCIAALRLSPPWWCKDRYARTIDWLRRTIAKSVLRQSEPRPLRHGRRHRRQDLSRLHPERPTHDHQLHHVDPTLPALEPRNHRLVATQEGGEPRLGLTRAQARVDQGLAERPLRVGVDRLRHGRRSEGSAGTSRRGAVSKFGSLHRRPRCMVRVAEWVFGRFVATAVSLGSPLPRVSADLWRSREHSNRAATGMPSRDARSDCRIGGGPTASSPSNKIGRQMGSYRSDWTCGSASLLIS